MPQLRADDLDGLAFAQGRNAAQDRTFQVDVGRWRAEGRSAERLGPSGVEWDRFARQARLDDTARRCHAALDDRTRRWVGAYVDGLNSALPRAVRSSYEHRELGVADAEVEPWQPWTPLAVLLVPHALFGSFPHKLWRWHVARTLGADGLRWLAADDPAGSGSNAVAVPGGRTASGLPLLAGDPHRVLELPGPYQQVRLRCPGVDVVGLAVPGTPGVAHFAHTGGVAWGITNSMADAQDLFLERLATRGGIAGCLGPDGWEPLRHSATESIQVRGADPVEVEVLETARGPVLVRATGTGPLGEEECVSLRTPVRAGAGLGTRAALDLLSARTVADVEQALARWVEPVNSVVAADSAGRVRHLVAGRVPQRADRDGPCPRPAWERSSGWTGWTTAPAREVTEVYTAANDRRDDTSCLAAHFAPAHRARRMGALLSGRSDLTADDLAAVPLDTASGQVTALQRLLARVDVDARTAAARDRLVAWDGRMDAGSTDAALFARWRSALVRSLCDDPALADLLRPSGFPVLYHWFTHVHERIGGVLEALAAGLGPPTLDVHRHAGVALTRVAHLPPTTWGELHLLDPVHPLEHVVDADEPRVPRTPLGGDGECLLATASMPGVGDTCWRGPVARWVWDLADRSASRWVVPFGASGDPGSPHHADQLPLWASGRLVPVPSDDPAGYDEAGYDEVGYDEVGQNEVGGADVPGLGRLWLRPLRPDADAARVHRWVTQERARFWGMLDHTVEEVRDVYRFVDSLPTHHAYLLHLDAVPVGVVQTYRPEHDPLGSCYRVEPGDVGLHLLLSPAGEPVPGFTGAVSRLLLDWLLRDPAHRRVVVEPDVRNEASIARLVREGFELGPVVQKPEKTARLAFWSRPR